MGKDADAILHAFAAKLDKGDFPNIAQENLKKGFSVVYCDDCWPDKMIREYPEGRKVLIELDADYKEVVVGELD